MKIITYSAVETDRFRLDWMPICTITQYNFCHDPKHPSSCCGYGAYSIDKCKRVVIEVHALGEDMK